jgi:hypothetical protein
MKNFLKNTWVKVTMIAAGGVIAVAAILAIGFTALYLYYTALPAQTAQMTVPGTSVRVTLQFYYVTDENRDSGRYLTIETPSRRAVFFLKGWDWAHNARTSLYFTQEGNIAVLEPAGDNDIVISLATLKSSSAHGVDSQSWNYLGAFDYSDRSYNRKLTFFSPDQQNECIPMLGVENYPLRPRPDARQRQCP